MAEYVDLELVRSIKGLLPDSHVLRLYRSRYLPKGKGEPIKTYRYHFGFPKGLIAPILPALEAVWGAHWKRDGEWWLWWLPITADEEPRGKLLSHLRVMFRQYNKALRIAKRVVAA